MIVVTAAATTTTTVAAATTTTTQPYIFCTFTTTRTSIQYLTLRGFLGDLYLDGFSNWRLLAKKTAYFRWNVIKV